MQPLIINLSLWPSVLHTKTQLNRPHTHIFTHTHTHTECYSCIYMAAITVRVRRLRWAGRLQLRPSRLQNAQIYTQRIGDVCAYNCIYISYVHLCVCVQYFCMNYELCKLCTHTHTERDSDRGTEVVRALGTGYVTCRQSCQVACRPNRRASCALR